MPRGSKEWRPSLNVRRLGVEESEDADCLVVKAPEWFERKDFLEWRDRSGVARWEGDTPESMDVFIVYADEAPDWHAEGLPRDIERALMALVRKHGMEYGVIWIKAL